ncbi:MAG: hypothetical protein ACOVQE_08910 [Chitinophagaceae bacterium]
MKKIIFLISLSLSIGYVKAQTDSLKTNFLQEGTVIEVELLKKISSKDANAGEIIDFALLEDIVINNKILINKGAKVIGTITLAEQSKALGKKGKLAFSIDYLYLKNGKAIKLRNHISKNIKGSGAAVAAGSLIVTPLVAFLFNGNNVIYEKGEIYKAYIDKDVSF